MIFNYNWFWRW